MDFTKEIGLDHNDESGNSHFYHVLFRICGYIEGERAWIRSGASTLIPKFASLSDDLEILIQDCDEEAELFGDLGCLDLHLAILKGSTV